MLHLALLNQLLHGSGDFFYGNVWVHAVLIEQIDDVGTQPLQRSIGNFLDVLRTAVQTTPTASIRCRLETELGGDLYLPTNRRQRFAYQFLIDQRPVNLG